MAISSPRSDKLLSCTIENQIDAVQAAGSWYPNCACVYTATYELGDRLFTAAPNGPGTSTMSGPSSPSKSIPADPRLTMPVAPSAVLSKALLNVYKRL
jgi:hypothetical protein